MPKAVVWYKVYAAILIVIYAVVAVLGITMLVADPVSPSMSSEEQAMMMANGVVLTFMGLVLGGVFVASLYLPRTNWAWVFQLVLICLGLTSPCFWPICIPLLIFYIKDDTRAWFKNE